jgi:hypothetical protein
MLEDRQNKGETEILDLRQSIEFLRQQNIILEEKLLNLTTQIANNNNNATATTEKPVVTTTDSTPSTTHEVRYCNTIIFLFPFQPVFQEPRKRIRAVLYFGVYECSLGGHIISMGLHNL